MIQEPLVTAIAVCYNHERYVVECLDSIISQTYRTFELIIIDDCSTDNSVSTIRKWIADRSFPCRFIAHTSNKGVCKTFNEAIQLSKGAYISIIATDDTWLPDKIAAQVAILESMPKEYGVVYGDAFQIDENGLHLTSRFIASHRSASFSPPDDVFDEIAQGNFIPAMSTLVRREVYETVGLYDPDLAFEDWDFWLRAARQYRFFYANRPFANYRILRTSMARTLLLKENPIAAYTYYLIYKKVLALGSSTTQGSTRTLTISRIQSSAKKLYRLKSPHAASALLYALRKEPNWRIAYLFICARLGVPHESALRLTSYLNWKANQVRTYFQKTWGKD